MDISAAALPFLILAAALGPPAHASLRFGSRTTAMPRRCCKSYDVIQIDCVKMNSYLLRIEGCPLPAVIFKTRESRGFCADPRLTLNKFCMEELDIARKVGKVMG